MKEPILEPLLRRMRLSRVVPYVHLYERCKLLDIGCGWDAKFLRTVEPFIGSGIGVDFKAPDIDTSKIKTISVTLTDKLPFDDSSFDVITMLAVMEHLENDVAILQECARLLRPGGAVLITVPSWYAKPVLEFLSFKLNIINPDEIADHKRYYNRRDICRLGEVVDGLTLERHRYFQGLFNNFAVFRRQIDD